MRAYDIGEIVAAYEVRAALEGAGLSPAAMRLSNDAVATLRNCLDEGDRIRKGVLLPDDHMPYQQVNITLHNSILEAAGNPWVRRFATQAQAIPYASDRIVLWEDHGIILRSHDDHHRIVNAIIGRRRARRGSDARACLLRRHHPEEQLREAGAGRSQAGHGAAGRTGSSAGLMRSVPLRRIPIRHAP